MKSFNEYTGREVETSKRLEPNNSASILDEITSNSDADHRQEQ